MNLPSDLGVVDRYYFFELGAVGEPLSVVGAVGWKVGVICLAVSTSCSWSVKVCAPLAF